MSLLPDKGIHLQPYQLTFRVVVQTAAPTLPSWSHQPQRLHGAGGIFERTPSASSTVVKHGRSFGQGFAILFRRPELRSRCEHVAEVFCKPFVDPEQITDHWLLVIRRRQAGWAAVLSIPGVDELMRQQAHFHQTQLWINQRTFGHAVVAGFVMLESVMSHFIAQRVKKVILGVMPRTEQRARLGYQRMVSGGLLRRHCESSFALTDRIDDMDWELPGLVQSNLAVVIACNQGRVDQLGQRNWLEFDHVVRLVLDRQSGAEFPSARQMDRCLELHGI